MNTKSKLLPLVHGAFFMALTIIFTFFLAIKTPIIRIDFAFIPLAIYASMWGPYRAGIMFALVDIFGTNLFLPGTYFFGFTITNFFTGFIYGKFLYKKELTLKRIFLMSLTTFIAVTCVLNNIWLTMQFQDAAFAFYTMRIIKGFIFVPIKTLVLFKLYQFLKPFIIKYSRLS